MSHPGTGTAAARGFATGAGHTVPPPAGHSPASPSTTGAGAGAGTSTSTEAAPHAVPSEWRADPYTHALTSGHGPLFLKGTDGERLPLGVERWCGTPDAADRTVVGRCEGAVLDIGCGPGRFVIALALAGHRTLGIDVNRAAVRRTVRQGGPALVRSVFDPVPREGRWNTALLVDGNIGIGGDPATLLARAAEILVPGGLLVVEVAARDIDERLEVRFDTGRSRTAEGEAFPWARLGTRALLRHAGTAGDWAGRETWDHAGRAFVALRSRTRPAPSSW
ncbi:class I SAM-dependent methyltransferase [Streptomyces sp. NBC_01497]|uniref:class I SAM-dependent methyltransferase n=1 Tax=Streptomyces sp. NBC_01497 TaxID=2903885 RepID=UPI002E337D6C|nr:methyltransferase domain-containing protein [Streptomyces sp. NBC_01497]